MDDCGCRENAPVCLLGIMQCRIINFYANRIKQADFPRLPVAARTSWLTSYQNAVEKYLRHVRENESNAGPP